MAVRAPGDTPDGTGYDPSTGWPPDESTINVWDNDVDLPGQFGRGGFHLNPRLIGPASGPPQGTSLTTPTNAVGMGPRIDPATGQPEMLTGPGGIVEKTRGAMNPFGFIGGGNPYWRGAIAAGGVLSPTPAETGELSPRFFTGQGVQPGLSAPQGTPYEVPRGMPGRAVDAPATYPHMPWPDTGVMPAAGQPAGAPATSSPAPAVPVAAPGGAVARQRPNLGTYGAPPAVVPNSPFTTLDYRPNSGPNERNRGSPVATALDLSRFFGGGQPAPTAAAPAVAAPAPPRPQVFSQPSIHMVNPGPSDPSIIARQRMRRPKSSSTSQGGGY